MTIGARRAGAPRAAADPTAAVWRLLHQHGIAAARVEAAGHESEIAAIAASPGEWSRIRDLSPRIKACGFRYVALDLDPASTGPGPMNSVPVSN